jgi:CheY-like chemotaxis protein
MIRVLIVDDEPPARRKVRHFLERDQEISEIREAASGKDAIAAIEMFAPDLVFLDVQMPDMDGFAVLSAAPSPRISTMRSGRLMQRRSIIYSSPSTPSASSVRWSGPKGRSRSAENACPRSLRDRS